MRILNLQRVRPFVTPLWSTGPEPLRLLCCCAPPYSDADIVPTE